jgi:polyisoprenoid-binding protein YceI
MTRKSNHLACMAALLCATLLGSTPAGWAKPLHFHVNGGGANNVEFTSDAPIEVMHGKTSKITGDITLDDSFKFDAKHPFNILLSVDLASIDTGIDLRNEHMRDNFLETGKYPNPDERQAGSPQAANR